MTTRRKLDLVARRTPPPGANVEERLKKAFPEIDLEKMMDDSGTINNRHNLTEKWNATVRNIEYWLGLAEQLSR